jgi:hypothetical protein
MNLSKLLFLGLASLGLVTGVTNADEPASPSAAQSVQAGQEPVLSSDVQSAGVPCWCGEASCAPGNRGLVGGVGLYVIQPYFDNNMAFGIQGTANRSSGAIPPGSPGIRVDQRIDISHHMEAAPEIWLGYINEDGLGARVRWWYFRQGTDQTVNGSGQGINSTLIFSAAPLGLSFLNGASSMEATSKLELQVWDLEALYELGAGGWDMQFSGGLRLAWINQTYNAYVPQNGNNTLLSSSTFDGLGPTLAVELHHPIWCGGLSFYSTLRGSLVFGSGHQMATVPDQSEVAQDHRDVGLAIGEVELGLEYGRRIGRSRLFGQLGLVGQEWSGAGSASRSSVNVLPGGGFVGAAYTGDSNIDFLGLSIRLGVNY